MAYDAAHSQVVMFGGYNNSQLSDTWVWDGTNWTQKAPAHNPPAREGARMVYDAAHSQVVMFGGYAGGGANLSDTWVWTGSDWTQQSPANSPSARTGYAMAYDEARQQTVLFGGYVGGSGVLADTWVWDGSTWTQKSPATSPPARTYGAMAYDGQHSQTVLFGGYNFVTGDITETWVWNGTNWIKQTPATVPPPVHSYSMVFDAARKQLLFFGGVSHSAYTGNTWVYTGTAFSKAFNPAQIPVGGTSTLTFTLSNNDPSLNLTGVAFSDTQPAGITNLNAGTNCSGTSVLTSTGYSLTGASLAASTQCTVSLSVTGTTAGVWLNQTTGGMSSNESGTTPAASATLTVVAPPSISVAFGATLIPVSSTTTVSFTINNPNSTVDLTGVSFSTTKNDLLALSSPAPVLSGCGAGVVSGFPGAINLTGATIAAGGQCIVTVTVQPTKLGVDNIITGNVNSTNGGKGNFDGTGVNVLYPPTISKKFGASSIALNGTTTLVFTLNSPNKGYLPLTGVSFNDPMPSGLTLVGTPSSSNCGTPVISGSPGAINVSGATVTFSNMFDCVITATVQGTTSGVKNNITSNVSSIEGGPGLAASDSLTVIGPPTITKKFGASSIPLNGTTTLTFTLTNPNGSGSLTGVAFSDTMPAGLTLTGVPTVSGCTVIGSIGTTSLNLSTAVTAGTNCVITFTVKGTTPGIKNNVTSNVSSNEGGSGATASDSLTVIAPPTISKAFGTQTIPLNGTTTLQFQITNPNAAVDLTGVAFTDTMPSGLSVLSSPAPVIAGCGSGALAGFPTAVNLTGATVSAGSTCTITVTVTGTMAGTQNNLTGKVSSTEGGAGSTAAASVTVIAPPTIIKAFGAQTIQLNGTTTLKFTIQNPNSLTLTAVAFTDAMPSGLTVVSTPAPVLNGCGPGTLSGLPTAVNLSGATIAGSSSCVVTVTVQGTTVGLQNNVTGNVSSTEGGTGATASASVTVIAPDLTATKTDSVNNSTTIGNNWTWTIHVANTGNADAVFPTGSTILNDNLQSLGITYGAPSVGNTTGTISGPINCAISAATLTCTANGAPVTIGAASAFDVTVQANPVAVTGMFFNPSAGGTCVVDPANVIVESNKNNNTCADSVTVTGPNPNGGFQIRYAANLAAGESYVNLTNTGASQGASICANVYTFSPDEQLISCCSCLITPNAIVSLGVKADLVSNTLTPAVPGSVVIKVASSLAVSNTCSPANPGTFNVPGLAAWGTSLHAVGSAYQQSETPFSASTPSLSEYNRITQLCSFINTAGSGYGICKSCRSGALGGAKQ